MTRPDIRPTPFTTRLKRLGQLVLWLLRTMHILRRDFHKANQSQREQAVQRIARELLAIMQVEVKVYGVVAQNMQRSLIAANHSSWLDMFALLAVYPMCFIAKQEIRTWPLIGGLIADAGTVFINRNQRKDTAKINAVIAATLQENGTVAFFPEAKTSDGLGLLPFKAALFQAAITARAEVQPVALRYYDSGGARTTLTAYVGNIHLLASLWRVLGSPHTVVRLDFAHPILHPLGDADFTRFQLKEQVQEAIADFVERPD